MLQGLVEGLEHRGLELPARQAEGLWCYGGLLDGRLVQDLKEAVQFRLQGGLGLVEEKEDEVLEGQVALPGEILRALPMVGDEVGVIQQIG